MSRFRAGIFRTNLGWAGAIVTERGISRIVLPLGGRRAVERALRQVGRRLSKRNALDAPRAVRNSTAECDRRQGLLLERTGTFLQAFFSGSPLFFALPLDLCYYTDFQRAVWKATAGIPYGETRSYGWIARKIRRPKAGRAVGQAMGVNPLPVIIP